MVARPARFKYTGIQKMIHDILALFTSTEVFIYVFMELVVRIESVWEAAIRASGWVT